MQEYMLVMKENDDEIAQECQQPRTAAIALLDIWIDVLCTDKALFIDAANKQLRQAEEQVPLTTPQYYWFGLLSRACLS